MRKYFDKNGVEITEGCTIRNNDGIENVVYMMDTEEDLGIMISKSECFSLSEFPMTDDWELVEWEVVK